MTHLEKRRTYHLLGIATLCWIIMSCGFKDSQRNQKRLTESISVYTSLIDSLILDKENHINETIIIIDSTCYLPAPGSYLYSLCDVQYFIMDSLLEQNEEYEMKLDFLAENRLPNIVSNYFKSDMQVTFINKNQLSDIKGTDPFVYHRLYEKYPEAKGLLTLSRVGFSKNYKHAILYYAYRKTSLSGEGLLVYLSKINGRWKVRKLKRLWIS